jgi:hypothetical protein
MLVKLGAIHLYTDTSEDSTAITNWFKENGVYSGNWQKPEEVEATAGFENLHYGDPSAHEGVFAALNTWTFANGDGPDGKFEFTGFPFLTYQEIHDDLQVGQVAPVAAIIGAEEIMESNILELMELGK